MIAANPMKIAVEKIAVDRAKQFRDMEPRLAEVGLHICMRIVEPSMSRRQGIDKRYYGQMQSADCFESDPSVTFL